jgi:hypothetical protein
MVLAVSVVEVVGGAVMVVLGGPSLWVLFRVAMARQGNLSVADPAPTPLIIGLIIAGVSVVAGIALFFAGFGLFGGGSTGSG